MEPITQCQVITVRNSSCGKVMFSQACVKNSVHWGVCMGGCMSGGTCCRGGHVWQGACMTAGEMATAADGTHPTGMHSCYILTSIYSSFSVISNVDVAQLLYNVVQ